ncbi:MAG: RNA polymerase sigma factor, partial [Pirellulales bacterium]|nr:RNA polymerase sigma factor [Pirellulales bacterium]
MVNRIHNTDCFLATENYSNEIFKSDEFLWSRYLATKDRRLFDQLVHRYEDEIYRHLYRLLGNAQLAEDARQGTFLKMHLKSNQFHPGRPLKPWLYAIATHEAIDLQRKNKRHRMQSLDQDETADGNSPQNLLNRLESRGSTPDQKMEREETR